MNKLMVVFAAALAAWNVIGGQCEGLTKDGVRCKREAAAKSSFCIGHADQAKTASKSAAKPEKLKDDGTCWAVTEAGSRCKHKKNGESDYCKQHGPDVKAKKAQTQCRALKWDGQRCERKPEGEFIYCAQHRKLGAAKPAKGEK